uniref:Ig-like domain-containing protein n=1 Tax=Cyanoderma ruficeps TaxID=181631 RepID=A0A8C3R4E0_9PASS
MSIFFLSVFELEPPTFVKKIENVTALAGDSVTLQAVVKGSEPISVTWMKGKDIIKDDNNVRVTFDHGLATLQITGVQLSSGGKYTCVAENDAGSQSCFGELAVKGQWRSAVVPAVSHLRGEEISFCTPELKTKWFKDGKTLPASKKYRISFKNNIAQLNPVALLCAQQSQKHNSTPVLLMCSFLSFFSLPTDHVLPASTVHFKGMFKGTTPLTVKWFKGDTELLTGGSCYIMTEALTSYLELYAVKPSDSGKYTCKVSNVAGSVTCSANLFVKEPAAFKEKLEPTHLVKKGGYAELACEVTGTPEIKITWFKDDRELKESDKYRISFTKSLAILHVSEVDTEDSGEYICKAENDAGKDICSSVVTVKESPYFSKEFQSMEVLKDSDVVLECEVLGTPPFEVFWVKDDKPVRSSKKHRISIEKSLISLHVFRFDASDVGEYECRVTNDVGSCLCRSEVTLKEPPQFLKKIENISSLRGGTVVFQAAIKGSLPITVSWLKDNDEVIEDNNIKMTFVNNVATLMVRSIELKHDGKYFCQAKNEAGIQRCSALLTVKGWSYPEGLQ